MNATANTTDNNHFKNSENIQINIKLYANFINKQFLQPAVCFSIDYP